MEIITAFIYIAEERTGRKLLKCIQQNKLDFRLAGCYVA